MPSRIAGVGSFSSCHTPNYACSVCHFSREKWGISDQKLRPRSEEPTRKAQQPTSAPQSATQECILRNLHHVPKRCIKSLAQQLPGGRVVYFPQRRARRARRSYTTVENVPSTEAPQMLRRVRQPGSLRRAQVCSIQGYVSKTTTSCSHQLVFMVGSVLCC